MIFSARCLSFDPFRNVALQLLVIIAVIEHHIHFFMDILKFHLHILIIKISAFDKLTFDLVIKNVDLFG